MDIFHHDLESVETSRFREFNFTHEVYSKIFINDPITGGNELRKCALAAGTADPETAALMFKLAEDYDKLADRRAKPLPPMAVAPLGDQQPKS